MHIYLSMHSGLGQTECHGNKLCHKKKRGGTASALKLFLVFACKKVQKNNSTKLSAATRDISQTSSRDTFFRMFLRTRRNRLKAYMYKTY